MDRNCKTVNPYTKKEITGLIRKSQENGSMDSLERRAKALSDTNRIKIYYALGVAELCVCEISELLGIPQPTVSGCLKELYNAGLLIRRKEGKWAYYSVVAQDPIKFEVPFHEIQ